MSQITDQIIQINVSQSLAGVGNANLGIPMFFALKSELTSGKTWADKQILTLASLNEVAEYFAPTTQTYLMASRWFAGHNGQTVPSLFYLRPDSLDPIEAFNDALNQEFFYHTFFDKSVFADHTSVLGLADAADAANCFLWIGSTEVANYDTQSETSILHKLFSKGNRHVMLSPRLTSTITTDPSQIYACFGAAALISRVDYTGLKTAITLDFKSIPGVIGENLTQSQIRALKQKRGSMFIYNKVAQNIDPSVSYYMYSMSGNSETIADVIDIDNFVWGLKINSYNLLRGSKKISLDTNGLARVINEGAIPICQQYINNGVFGPGMLFSEREGENVLTDGYYIQTVPEDALKLTSAQKIDREMYPLSISVLLARSAHVIRYNITIA